MVVQYVDKTLLAWLGNRLADVGNVTGLEQLGDINPSSFSFLLLGIALVVMMRFRPEGFLPSRQRAAEMHTAPPGQAIGSIGLLEEEGVVPELDPTEPGGDEDRRDRRGARRGARRPDHRGEPRRGHRPRRGDAAMTAAARTRRARRR